MNRFHSILLMVILAFASSVLATGRNSVAARVMGNGYFNVASMNNNGEYEIAAIDSLDGAYLYVESGWLGGCCDSPRYIGLSIGNNLSSERNESIWFLTDYFRIDSLNSELKKGKPLPLEKFTKLEFDSTHVQYHVFNFNINGNKDIKTNRVITEDTTYVMGKNGNIEFFPNVTKPDAIIFDYILFQREDSVAAFCGIICNLCNFTIECFYQNDGSFVFDSLPTLSKQLSGAGCVYMGDGSPLPPVNQNLNKLNILDAKTYKINGTPATKGSSNIVIRKNKQPKLRLKGKL